MVDETIKGVITRLKIHDDQRKYGLQIDEDPRWFNGFDLPLKIVEGVEVELFYYLKVVEEKTYFNVTKIILHHRIKPFFRCPRCNIDLEVVAASTQ